MNSFNYFPVPTRVWSRVEKPYIYILPNSVNSYNSDSNIVYSKLDNKIISVTQANYQTKQIYKGNILQYKKNSARLTKSQKYSQISRNVGPSRKKVYSTQTETYTNPNSVSLLRVGYYYYNLNNTDQNLVNFCDNSTNYIQDGGILVLGTFINQCNNDVIKKIPTTPIVINTSSASNVPGNENLYWNNKVQSWFPKTNYINNNSGNKWPVNYKGLVSAIHSKSI